jgi:hypothetical protein
MRLGLAEYQEPDDPEPNWVMRDFFLELVVKMAPQVLRELWSDVLPFYLELPDEFGRRPPQYFGGDLRDGWSLFDRAADNSKSVRRFKEALIGWASSHGLRAEWVLNRALATLQRWTTDHLTPVTPTSADLRFSRIGRSWGHTVSVEEMFYEFRCPGWDPRGITRQGYRRQVEAAFREHLGKYLDRVGGYAAERGMVRTRKWRRRDEEVGRRMKWLAQRRILKLSVADIARADLVLSQASAITREERVRIQERVRVGLRLAAQEIGLPGSPGRPRKSPSP